MSRVQWETLSGRYGAGPVLMTLEPCARCEVRSCYCHGCLRDGERALFLLCVRACARVSVCLGLVHILPLPGIIVLFANVSPPTLACRRKVQLLQSAAFGKRPASRLWTRIMTLRPTRTPGGTSSATRGCRSGVRSSTTVRERMAVCVCTCVSVSVSVSVGVSVCVCVCVCVEFACVVCLCVCGDSGPDGRHGARFPAPRTHLQPPPAQAEWGPHPEPATRPCGPLPRHQRQGVVSVPGHLWRRAPPTAQDPGHLRHHTLLIVL